MRRVWGIVGNGALKIMQVARDSAIKATAQASSDALMRVTAPIAQNETNQCFLTPPWFIQDTGDKSKRAPPLLPATFKLLINGEQAFHEIHDAIDNAEHSVNIICLGFQPSMYFKRRGGKAERIGELLERKGGKGKSGIPINMLCYVVEPAGLPVSTTGQFAGEAYTPGQHAIGISDRPGTSSEENYWYNQEWFARYDETQSVANVVADSAKDVIATLVLVYVGALTSIESGGASLAVAARKGFFCATRVLIRTVDLLRRVSIKFDAKPRTANIKFAVRGFSALDRANILVKGHDGQDVGTMNSVMLAAGPSHHQKVILIDCEDPEKAVAFVMGHNLLDEYWDTNEHSYVRRPPNESDLGRNGARPRHDFSSRVTGPAIGELVENFATAWLRDTNQALIPPPKPFWQYPLQPNYANRPSMVQITRTQPQEDRREIKAAYLQAVNNATQYIHIENQYFRWPELADKICACAKGQTGGKRKPELHGPLYVFVITNADLDAIGSGTEKTARMLDKLGRAEVLPEVSRQVQPDDNRAEMARAQREADIERARQDQLRAESTGNKDLYANKDYQASKTSQRAAEAREKELQARQATLTDKRYVVAPDGRPGLKVHICTLVAPDTPGRTVSDKDQSLTRYERIEKLEKQRLETRVRISSLLRERDDYDRRLLELPDKDPITENVKKERAKVNEQINKELGPITDELDKLKDGSDPIDWVDVYIHAKLMLIDDTFMTIGSANINIRSMDTDSELNISHANPEITRKARQQLWTQHTKGMSGSEAFKKEGLETAYKVWEELMNKNKDLRFKKKSPEASLVEFYSGTQDRTDKD